jgi:hypothetical protein
MVDDGVNHVSKGNASLSTVHEAVAEMGNERPQMNTRFGMTYKPAEHKNLTQTVVQMGTLAILKLPQKGFCRRCLVFYDTQS